MQTRAAKRRCLEMDDAVLSSTLPCLLPLLQPVRLCLHTFISSRDAARLMQASRSITACLLTDYAFVDHVFEHRSVAAAKRSYALFALYHMRILRLCLPREWNEPLIDRTTGRSLLPASLVALTMGEEPSGPMDKKMMHAAFTGGEAEEAEVEDDGGWAEYGDRRLTRLVRQWEETNSCSTWKQSPYGGGAGFFDKPIPPGALPRSLRCLHFNNNYNQPLQAGGISEGVQVVHFGYAFNQVLEAGHLPASLTHLGFGAMYNEQLLPGVLPTGLQRLHLGGQYKHPLQPGALPAQLRRLTLSHDYNQPLLPGAIPRSVTHLELNDSFIQPLSVGSVPEGIVHLRLGDAFNHPLLPGVLPTSLRVLVINNHDQRALQPGSLPDGLQVLAFRERSMLRHTLQPGVIPASVIVVSMSRFYGAKLVAGSIPSTVRWLRLPYKYAEKELRGVLSPATRIVTWAD